MLIRVNDADVSLGQAQFVAAGGEGSVYARGSTGYKIYTDQKRTIPLGKISALQKIKDPRVITPQHPAYKGRRHVGHSFRFVRDTRALCEHFPRAFREREGMTWSNTHKLVLGLREGVEAVHAAGCLLVDLNEMNFLVSQDFQDLYFIDVDSYQTPGYPATAIMPSVRDWATPIGKFHPGSDWFSFGIITYQMFRGVHPFKGKHPNFKGAKLEERMKANVSVFDPLVRLPARAYQENVIPSAWLDWYRAVFVEGKRVAPPVDMRGTLPPLQGAPVVSGARLALEDVFLFRDPARGVWDHQGRLVGASTAVAQVQGQPAICARGVVGVVTTPSGDLVLVLKCPEGVYGFNTRTGASSDPCPVESAVSAQSRVYGRVGATVVELSARTAGTKTFLAPRVVAKVLRNATRLFPGLVIQNMLGAPVISLLPRSGVSYQVTIPELKGLRVHDAKFEGGVLVAIVSEAGVYHRMVFRFSEDYMSYDVRKVGDIAAATVSFAVLDTGTCVCMAEDGLELFSTRKDSSAIKTLDDKGLLAGMELRSANSALLAIGQERVVRLRMT